MKNVSKTLRINESYLEEFIEKNNVIQVTETEKGIATIDIKRGFSRFSGIPVIIDNTIETYVFEEE